MPFNLDAYLGIQPAALEVYTERAQVLGANLANADTPGYLARDIDFRAALAAAGSPDGTLQPATGDAADPIASNAPEAGSRSRRPSDVAHVVTACDLRLGTMRLRRSKPRSP